MPPETPALEPPYDMFMRIAKASARWAWGRFDHEEIGEALEVEEGDDAYESLVRWFYTIAVANYAQDIPVLQDPPVRAKSPER